MSRNTPSWAYSYSNMMSRCYNKNHRYFSRYGGRGIEVCDQWKGRPQQFYADMGDRPAECTLDRIDNDKGYAPDNCRWATASEQARNRVDSLFVTYEGESVDIHEASRKSGINVRTLKDRIKTQGLSGDDLFRPLMSNQERTSKSGKSRRKVAKVFHPNGDLSLVYDVQAFCRKHNLDNGNFSRTLRGINAHCRGFNGHYVGVA